jgi:hypothetical protein
MSDVVIDLYSHIIYSGTPDDVVNWLLSVDVESGVKVIVGKTKVPLSADDYLSARTIRLGDYRVRMIDPADK